MGFSATINAIKLGAQPRAGGGGAPVEWVTPTIPQSANIVRAWSTRRLIPAYKDGIAIKADRTSPLGGDPDDGFLVPFRNDGTILIPNGNDAYAYELHEQHGVSSAKLINPVFANCPNVFASNSMRKGLLYDGINDTLYGTSVDTAIDAAFNAISFGEPHNDKGIAMSFWYYPVSYANNARPFYYGGAGYILLNQSTTWSHTLRFGSNASYSLISIQSGEWSMVSAVLKNGTQKTYVNGVPINSIAVAGLSPGTSPMSICSFRGYSNFASAQVNDILFWNNELSDQQMLELYNQTKGYYGIV